MKLAKIQKTCACGEHHEIATDYILFETRLGIYLQFQCDCDSTLVTKDFLLLPPQKLEQRTEVREWKN